MLQQLDLDMFRLADISTSGGGAGVGVSGGVSLLDCDSLQA